MEKPAEAQAKILEEEEKDSPIQDVNMCEECGKNAVKYKCPRCNIRSCSLGCVNYHKERTNCNGKRDRTQFVALSEFDDNWLISDYNFLEEALRMTESAKRSRGRVDDGRASWGMNGGNKAGKPCWRMNAGQKALHTQARNRNANLLFLSKGMSKNRTNKSLYNKRRKCIYWTVEWQFHSTDVTFTDHHVDEHSSLQSILEKHLTIGPGNPVIRHKLRHFCNESINNLKLLMKKEYIMGNRRLYFELNIKEPLRSQLMHKTIIEYPVIHVILPSNLMEYELCKVGTPVYDKVVKPSSIKKLDFLGHQEGIPFREEEIGGEIEPSTDLNPFPERKNEEVIICREEIKEGKTKTIKVSNLVPQKSVNPSNSGEHDDPVQLDGIPLREEEIEEGELELIKDKNLVPEEFLRTSKFDELGDPVQLEKAPLREEEIKDGELELIKDENPIPEICLRKSSLGELNDSVQLKEIPLREEENKEGEFELFNEENPAPDKFLRTSNFDELDDLLHLEDLPFMPFREEIEEGEFVAHQHFSEDFPMQVDIDVAMNGVNTE